MAEEQTSEELEAAKAQEEAEAEEQKAAEEEQTEEEEDEQRDPGSEMVASWGYNREAEELEVIFQNGHEESYSCSPAQWEDAKATSSAGKWMHATML